MCSKFLYSSKTLYINQGNWTYITLQLSSLCYTWTSRFLLIKVTNFLSSSPCHSVSPAKWTSLNISYDLGSSKITHLCFLARWRIPTHLLVKPLKRRKNLLKKTCWSNLQSAWTTLQTGSAPFRQEVWHESLSHLYLPFVFVLVLYLPLTRRLPCSKLSHHLTHVDTLFDHFFLVDKQS